MLVSSHNPPTLLVCSFMIRPVPALSHDDGIISSVTSSKMSRPDGTNSIATAGLGDIVDLDNNWRQ
jgi:hypothetical protein